MQVQSSYDDCTIIKYDTDIQSITRYRFEYSVTRNILDSNLEYSGVDILVQLYMNNVIDNASVPSKLDSFVLEGNNYDTHTYILSDIYINPRNTFTLHFDLVKSNLMSYETFNTLKNGINLKLKIRIIEYSSLYYIYTNLFDRFPVYEQKRCTFNSKGELVDNSLVSTEYTLRELPAQNFIIVETTLSLYINSNNDQLYSGVFGLSMYESGQWSDSLGTLLTSTPMSFSTENDIIAIGVANTEIGTVEELNLGLQAVLYSDRGSKVIITNDTLVNMNVKMTLNWIYFMQLKVAYTIEDEQENLYVRILDTAYDLSASRFQNVYSQNII